MAYTDTPDSIYASLTDLGRINFARSAMGEVAFKVVGFDVGLGGYQVNPVHIVPIDPSQTALIYHLYPNAYAAATTIIGDSGIGASIKVNSTNYIGVPLTLVNGYKILTYSVGVNVTGPILGYLKVQIVRDSGGSPSLLPMDVLFNRSFDVSVLPVGNTTLTAQVGIEYQAGSYWLLVYGDSVYQTTITGTNYLSLTGANSGTNQAVVGTPFAPSGIYINEQVIGEQIGVPTWKPYITYEAPTTKTLVFNCRLNPEEATGGLGEIGLWAQILNSSTPSEIGTYFMLGVGHFPIQTKTRRQAMVFRYIVQL